MKYVKVGVTVLVLVSQVSYCPILRALGLRPHGNARWLVFHNGNRFNLVHVLTARSRSARGTPFQWDRSVDKRGACNSNYFAEGDFTFEQMVTMAKARFAPRWDKMKFEVRLVFDSPVK